MVVNIDNATNRIIYNRILRECRKLLMQTVFEFNDDYTREDISVKIKALLNRAKTHAIKDYTYTILDYDRAKPHYIEIHIALLFKNKINQVLIHLNNVDSNL